MPKVTIEWTEEEKAERRARGAALGIACCLACGETRLLTPFQPIEYFKGEFDVENVSRGKDEPIQRVNGSKSVSFVCEDCWAKMSVEERVELTEKYLSSRPDDIRPPLRVPLKHGRFRVDHEDKARYEAEVQNKRVEDEMILEAVRSSK